MWLSKGDDYRLDNNFFSPAAYQAEQAIRRLSRSETGRVLALRHLVLPGTLVTGTEPTADGLIAVAEGRNLRPNYVLPIFSKYTEDVAVELLPGDIIMGKDGEPGTVAVITQVLLDYCPPFTIANHVYRFRLKEQYVEAAYLVGAFLNSRTGQALVRKIIAGGTTPTIRRDELSAVPIFVPEDRELWAQVKEEIVRVQAAVLASLKNLGPSDMLIQALGVEEAFARLPINWVGGGRSDPHGYYRD